MKLKDRINNDLIYQIGERGDIIVPNYYLGMWEADVLRIRRSGLVYEYEVKTTRHDYFNDFKKEVGGRWTPLRNKHKELENGTRECNRFFFVVPENLVTKDEVPPYAGLVYYKEYKYKEESHGHFSQILQGKLIRKKFPVDYEKIARKLAFRENILRMKHRNHHQTLADLQEENRWLRAQNKKLKKEPPVMQAIYEYGVVAPIGEDYWAGLSDEDKIKSYFTCMYGNKFPYSMVDDGILNEFCDFNKINKDVTITYLKQMTNEKGRIQGNAEES